MITFNYFLRKKSDISSDQFRSYWLEDHTDASLALVEKLGVRRYTKCETKHEDDVTIALQQMYGSATDSYDFVDQMVINDLEEFKKGLDDPEIQKELKQLHEKSRAYVDIGRSDIWFSIDVPQVFAGEACTATLESTDLKVFYLGSYHDHLSMGEAQLHWNACHGGMARQFIKMLPYKQYIQGHKIDSKVADSFANLLGGGFENRERVMGQAEAWIDRRIVPSLRGPEVERMMGMLVTDIGLFVDTKNANMFATKEHVIFNRPVITDSIPTLFNAD